MDSGDIIIRASFKFFQNTADFKKVDNELSLILIKKILKKWPNGKFDTLKQKVESYRPRRIKDNKIKINNNINSVLPHLHD